MRTRRERDIYRVTEGILSDQKYGPRSTCACCGRELGDPESVQRGIGPTCWPVVLKAVEQQRSRKRYPLGRCPNDRSHETYLTDADRFVHCASGCDLAAALSRRAN